GFIRHYEYHDAQYLNFCNMVLAAPDTLVISGSTRNVTGNNNQGIYLAKADTFGNVIMETVLTPDDDHFIYEDQYGFIRTSDGGYAIVGQYYSRNNGVLIKTDGNFNIEFVSEFIENPDVIRNIRNEDIIQLGDFFYIKARK